MADEKKNYFQEATRDGKRWRQCIAPDGKILCEEELGDAVTTKPTPPAAEPEVKTEVASDPPANSTVVDKQEEKKGLTGKAKKGLAIAGGVVGGVLLYALGGKRGRAAGEADGYVKGYSEGSADLANSTEPTEATWEAPE